MTTINRQLFAAIVKKTGLSQAQAYQRIKETAANELLPRHLAAIKVGADIGLTINKYASADDLAQLRQAGTPVAPPTSVDLSKSLSNGSNLRRGQKAKKLIKLTKNQVFVVHGRDTVAKDAIFAFLRALGVKPIEWNAAVKMSKKPTPYIGEILATAFANARAVVVLLTPDDVAQLRADLLSTTDPPFESRLTGQARPNVLFEAGMAFSSHPDRTVMVQLGTVRPFSDTAGRHVLHMSNAAEKRQEFATKLQNAGCDVDSSGTDWLSVGDFSNPETRIPAGSSKRSRKALS
jgi:predicted nucleotide-binding protein